MVIPEKQASISIHPYKAEWRERFVALNRQWIETFFVLEPQDLAELEAVEDTILAKGGFVLFAILEEPVAELPKGAVAGVCGIVPYPYNISAGHPFENQRVYELVKMAVDPKVQGFRIGTRLLGAALDTMKSHEAGWAYLETSADRIAAVKMYTRAGFELIPPEQRAESPYVRATAHYRLSLT